MPSSTGTTLRNGSTCGCRTAANSAASRPNRSCAGRSRAPSAPVRSPLSATTSPLASSCARHTSPVAPKPSNRSTPYPVSVHTAPTAISSGCPDMRLGSAADQPGELSTGQAWLSPAGSRSRGATTVSTSRSGTRASALGHQTRDPMSKVRAGTSTERTTNVSSSTPKATTKPTSAKATRDRQPAEHPAPGTDHRGFLPHPAHQEDVVVDAQGHQEDEGEQRERGVRAGETEHHIEDHRAGPERRQVGQDHRRYQHQRRDHRVE